MRTNRLVKVMGAVILVGVVLMALQPGTISGLASTANRLGAIWGSPDSSRFDVEPAAGPMPGARFDEEASPRELRAVGLSPNSEPAAARPPAARIRFDSEPLPRTRQASQPRFDSEQAPANRSMATPRFDSE